MRSAHDHVAQGIALYDPQKHNPFVSRAVQDSKVSCLSFAARALWMLGYPDQALKSIQRLWQQQGKKKQARKMLAEIYNWFTEGFDTKDLQEAKALLGKLS